MNPQQIQAAALAWQQGRALQDAGRYREAEPLLRKALQLMPANAPLLADYGLLAEQLGDWRAAEAIWRQVAGLDPARRTLNHIGLALLGQGRAQEALSPLREHAARFPDDAASAINLAVALTTLQQDGEAIDVLRAALARSPDHEQAHETLVTLLVNAGRADEVAAALAAARPRFPDNPELRYAEMEHRLKCGEFGAGFDLFDTRWDTRFCRQPLRIAPERRWDGRPFDGTLLVRAEQGLGDEIIYSSLFPDLLRVQPRCVITADPRLLPLYGRSFPGATLVASGTPHDDPRLAGTTREIMAGDLARLFRRTAGDFPTTPGWLQADPARTAALRQAYDTRFGDALRVGLGWRSLHPDNGTAKTLRLDQLLPLLRTPGVQFFDLQYGDTAGERESLLKDHGVALYRDPKVDPLHDIDALAAQLGALDLLVSTSNSTVHLAGALGIPVLVLLHRDRGTPWYWQYDAVQVPLYPATRLLRCPARGAWEPVIAEAADLVAARARAR